jgi:N6-adenosine-specific RNA methylase IME4
MSKKNLKPVINEYLLSLPTGSRYSCIMADPPWTHTFSTRKTEIQGTGWRDMPYPTMTLESIKAINVASVCAENAALFLWVCNPLLVQGLEVMAAWGFEYKTMFTWGKVDKKGKPSFGMGYWARGASEHMLFGVKGKIKPNSRKEVTWFPSPRLRHSEKPPESYAIAERLIQGPRLELFSRVKRDGWDTFIYEDVSLKRENDAAFDILRQATI